MVVKLLYPNDWTIKLPKVEMPPLAMLWKNVSITTHVQVDNGSRNVRDSNDENEPAPRLQVQERLPDVVPAPDSRLNTHLVRTKSLNGDDLFSLGQVLG